MAETAAVGRLTVGLAVLILGAAWLARRRWSLRLAAVAVEDMPPIHSRWLPEPRPAHVYLPPLYAKALDRTYPLLLLNDGQEAGALHLRQTLARLYAEGKLQPVIVVAIPATARRLEEYGTSAQPNVQGFGASADDYAHFVVDELLPELRARFRLADGASQAGIAGMSLGGLSAFDIAWSHADRFGLVGVFSGSFWWRAGANEGPVPDGELIVPARVRQIGHQPGFRAWLQVGTRDERDDRDGDGVIDAIADTRAVRDALLHVGFSRDEDVTLLEIADGRHRYETWREVLPTFLIWAFGRR
jgi:enterochelin esterase-like enzyme